MGTGGCYPGVKRQGREADYSPQLRPEIQNVWTYIPLPQYVFMVWQLVNCRGNFTFTGKQKRSMKSTYPSIFVSAL